MFARCRGRGRRGRSHGGNSTRRNSRGLARRRGRERPGRCSRRENARRPRARPLWPAKISVFLTGSFGYGKKWQPDFYKRPHYRQTVEETIARRLSFYCQCAPAVGGIGGRARPGGVQTWWGARSGGVNNAIIVVSAASRGAWLQQVVRVTDGKASPGECSDSKFGRGLGQRQQQPQHFQTECTAFDARNSAHRVLAIAVCYDA
jgi:hypothetical protein